MLFTIRRSLNYFRRYWITPASIWLRQPDGWVELRLDEIFVVKIQSVRHVIVRYYDGRRFVVSLFGFSNPAYDDVCRALNEAVDRNEQTRGS
jgi:hypothetical protein